MSKMSELFYDILEMLELGRTDSDISLATGFPVEAIAIWRADADLRPESASEESDWQQDTGPGNEDGWDPKTDFYVSQEEMNGINARLMNTLRG